MSRDGRKRHRVSFAPDAQVTVFNDQPSPSSGLYKDQRRLSPVKDHSDSPPSNTQRARPLPGRRRLSSDDDSDMSLDQNAQRGTLKAHLEHLKRSQAVGSFSPTPECIGPAGQMQRRSSTDSQLSPSVHQGIHNLSNVDSTPLMERARRIGVNDADFNISDVSGMSKSPSSEAGAVSGSRRRDADSEDSGDEPAVEDESGGAGISQPRSPDPAGSPQFGHRGISPIQPVPGQDADDSFNGPLASAHFADDEQDGGYGGGGGFGFGDSDSSDNETLPSGGEEASGSGSERDRDSEEERGFGGDSRTQNMSLTHAGGGILKHAARESGERANAPSRRKRGFSLGGDALGNGGGFPEDFGSDEDDDDNETIHSERSASGSDRGHSPDRGGGAHNGSYIAYDENGSPGRAPENAGSFHEAMLDQPRGPAPHEEPQAAGDPGGYKESEPVSRADSPAGGRPRRARRETKFVKDEDRRDYSSDEHECSFRPEHGQGSFMVGDDDDDDETVQVSTAREEPPARQYEDKILPCDQNNSVGSPNPALAEARQKPNQPRRARRATANLFVNEERYGLGGDPAPRPARRRGTMDALEGAYYGMDATATHKLDPAQLPLPNKRASLAASRRDSTNLTGLDKDTAHMKHNMKDVLQNEQSLNDTAELRDIMGLADGRAPDNDHKFIQDMLGVEGQEFGGRARKRRRTVVVPESFENSPEPPEDPTDARMALGVPGDAAGLNDSRRSDYSDFSNDDSMANQENLENLLKNKLSFDLSTDRHRNVRPSTGRNSLANEMRTESLVGKLLSTCIQVPETEMLEKLQKSLSDEISAFQDQRHACNKRMRELGPSHPLYEHIDSTTASQTDGIQRRLTQAKAYFRTIAKRDYLKLVQAANRSYKSSLVHVRADLADDLQKLERMIADMRNATKNTKRALRALQEQAQPSPGQQEQQAVVAENAREIKKLTDRTAALEQRKVALEKEISSESGTIQELEQHRAQLMKQWESQEDMQEREEWLEYQAAWEEEEQGYEVLQTSETSLALLWHGCVMTKFSFDSRGPGKVVTDVIIHTSVEANPQEDRYASTKEFMMFAANLFEADFPLVRQQAGKTEKELQAFLGDLSARWHGVMDIEDDLALLEDHEASKVCNMVTEHVVGGLSMLKLWVCDPPYQDTDAPLVLLELTVRPGYPYNVDIPLLSEGDGASFKCRVVRNAPGSTFTEADVLEAVAKVVPGNNYIVQCAEAVRALW